MNETAIFVTFFCYRPLRLFYANECIVISTSGFSVELWRPRDWFCDYQHCTSM